MSTSLFGRGPDTASADRTADQNAAQDELSRGRAGARAAAGNRSIGGNRNTHTAVGSPQARHTGRAAR